MSVLKTKLIKTAWWYFYYYQYDETLINPILLSILVYLKKLFSLCYKILNNVYQNLALQCTLY